MKLERILYAGLLCWALSFGVANPAWARHNALPDFTGLIEQEARAVVNISTLQSHAGQAYSLDDDEQRGVLEELFRRLFPNPQDNPGFRGEGASLGSGFIISADGYILTNAHVIEGADEILVRLADKREFHAQVVGADVRSDVALLRIDAQDLPVVRLASANHLQVGEWVLAIGSPFGFDQSVTAGIVSAKGRSLPDENFVPFIQTDVAINPGNSGGPLFNLSGEVVGMNSQIYSQTGGFMGLSFAIPIDVAMDVQAQLREYGQVRRGRIGVVVQEVTQAIASSFALPEAAGALISDLEPDGPAALAGLRSGDVITSFNGVAVRSSNDLPRIVAGCRPGTLVNVDLVRDAQAMTVEVEVGEWQTLEKPQQPAGSEPQNLPGNSLGLAVKMPSEEQRRVRAVESGLLIERVSGPAAQADIRPGDVLLAMVVGGAKHELDSVEQFEQLSAGLSSGQTVSVLVARVGAQLYVALKAGGGG